MANIERTLNKNTIGIIEASRRFIKSLKASGRSEATQTSYASKINLLHSLLGDISLNQITSEKLENALLELERGYHTNKPRSIASMNQIRSVLRTFFLWAFSSGFISFSPAADLRLAKLVTRRSPMITKEDLTKLYNAMRDDRTFIARRDEALFSIYTYTGIRRNEGLSIKTGDLDFHENRIWIDKTKTTGYAYRIMTQSLKSLLMEYLVQRSRNKLCLRSPFLFPGRDLSNPLSGREANLRFDYWKRMARITSILTIHSFRASFATRLYQATKDVVLVSNALGHKSVSSIDHYISIQENALRSAIEKAFRKL